MLRKATLFSIIGIFGCLSLLLIPAPSAAHGFCDRACLEGFVNTYIDALVSRDPSALPVSRQVKFTENTAELKLGQGFWKTVNGQGTFKIYVTDTRKGEVGFVGTMYEHTNPINQPGSLVPFGLRLRVVGHKITEIETFVHRGLAGTVLFNPDNLVTPRPAFTEMLKPSERTPYKAMAKIPNLYGRAYTTGDMALNMALFSDDSTRRENGTQTTNAPDMVPWLKLFLQPSGLELTALPTGIQNLTGGGVGGVMASTDNIVIDEERGLVWAVLMGGGTGEEKYFVKYSFPISKEIIGPYFGGQDYPGGELIPFPGGPTPGGSAINEVFKVKKGMIHEIEAVYNLGLPYGAEDGWGYKPPTEVEE